MPSNSADSASAAPSTEKSWRPVRDSNPCSIPASERGDVENRSLLFVQDTGRDPAIASPRECDCRPWVVRCVHTGDDVIGLGFRDLLAESVKPLWGNGGDDYWLGKRVPDHTGEEPYVWGPCPVNGRWRFDSEADALAAFYAAEAELLGREPETPLARRIAALPPTKFSTATKEARDRAAQWEP